jgi:hypothetical protein
MAGKHAQASLLLRLPREILLSIIDELLDKHALAMLRITCKGLSEDNAIDSQVFKEITIRGTIQGTRSMNDNAFAKVAPHVTRVIFQPSLSEEHLMSKDAFTSRLKKTISDCLEPSMRSDVPDLDLQYQRYMGLAAEAPETDIVVAGIAALKQMPKLSNIATGSGFSFMTIKLQNAVSIRVYIGTDDGEALADSCDRLFRRVIAILSGSGSDVKLTQLLISHFSNAATRWNELANGSLLNLTALQLLHFGLRSQSNVYFEDGDYHDRASNFLHELQEKCRESLRWLVIGPGRPTDLGPLIEFLYKSGVIMLSLTCTTLDRCRINISSFASFISGHKTLRSLTIVRTDYYDGSGYWRKVWDAIKDRGDSLHLLISHMVCGQNLEFSITHGIDGENKESSFF